MGKRGPRKLPAKVHEKRGTKKRCRHAEPKVPGAATIPPPPAELSEIAGRVWNDVGTKLVKAGLLTELDELALRLLCESVEMYFEACRECVGQLTIESDKGNVLQNPAVAIRNRAWAQIVKLCQEFGLTPSARTGLNVDAKPPEDDAVSKILGFKVIG